MNTRQIVLLDPENLAGTGVLADWSPISLVRQLTELNPIRADDIVIVGGDRRNAFQLNDIAKRLGGTTVWGYGPDGAEIALEKAFNAIPPTAWDNESAPVTRVVICSGDHYFVRTAEIAHGKGRSVLTISRWRGLSYKLARVSDVCLSIASAPEDELAGLNTATERSLISRRRAGLGVGI